MHWWFALIHSTIPFVFVRFEEAPLFSLPKSTEGELDPLEWSIWIVCNLPGPKPKTARILQYLFTIFERIVVALLFSDPEEQEHVNHQD